MSEGLKFTKAEIPVVTREAEHNPFDGNLPAVGTQAISTTVPFASDGPEVRKLVSQARKAAKAAQVTARVKTESGGTKAKPTTTLTVWTVPAIFRPRSTDAPAAAAE